MKNRILVAFGLLLLTVSSSTLAIRIANVPKWASIEVARLEMLHNRETGGGMLIATPAKPCTDCTPVSLTYDASVSVSINGFDKGKAIDRSQVVTGSVSYDPETMKVASINIYQ